MRVLLIDDEKELVSTLSSRLALRNIDSDWATNGSDGLELVREHDYDWIVLDLKMPGLSGYEAIRAIRQIRPHTRIILLTGHSAREDLDRALELGADRYLVKPVDIRDLVDLLNGVIPEEQS